MYPALRFKLKLLIITGYEHFSELFLSDVADELNTLNLLDFLVITDRNGEE